MNNKLLAAALAVLAGGVAASYVFTRPKAGCVMRPIGVAASECMRKLPQLGIIDFGEENVFPGSEAVGSGCAKVDCATGATTEVQTK